MLLAILVVSLGADRVWCQSPPPGYSPYLNLARPGSPGMNYYGLVRPQVEFRNDLQQLQRTTTTLQSGVSQFMSGDLATGHPAAFMYFGGYYSGLGRGSLPPARSLPSTAAPRSPATPVAGYRR